MTNPERDAEQEAISRLIYQRAKDCWSGEFPISIDVADYIAKAIVGHRAAELARVREELEDSNGAYRSVMEEACAGGITYDTDDRLHCTCVPHLREGIKAIKAQHEAALADTRVFQNENHRLLVQQMEAHREIERLRQQNAALREALDEAQEILAEPGTPPKSVWKAWQANHAEILATPPAHGGQG